ncbi:MAG TPA: hypothetical protein VH482_25735 [Thermomicrobiales bacterium]|jgi:hypothetical protein
MDGNRFDRWARTFAAARSRRDVAKGFVAGALAAVGTGLGLESHLAEAAARAPRPKRKCDATCKQRCRLGCEGLGTRAERACRLACESCGGDFDQVCFEFGPFGPVSIACCAGETFCNFDTGQCEPPAVCDAQSGCLGGTCGAGCFCVTTTEQTGACVNGDFASCDNDPCNDSSDCNGGFCVDAGECCEPGIKVCFPPEAICNSGGVGLQGLRTTPPGWHR